MSYIGGPFKYDVCASYSHGDPKGAGTSQFKRYSQGFLRELTTELCAHPTFGDKLKVFFDDHGEPGETLDPNAGLTGQLREAMGQAAVFTVLMSDHYLRSKWCADEREFWLQGAAALGMPLTDRLALARIWNTTEPWPAALMDERGNPFVGTSFFDQAQVATAPWPFAWPEPAPDSRDPFRGRLLGMVSLIWQQIERLKARVESQRKAQEDVDRLGGDSNQVIYLHARAADADAWAQAGQALSDQGYAVLPGEPDEVEGDPEKALRARSERVKTMSGCDALLLVGSPEASAVEADLVVVGRQDRDSARALARRILPCALLDTVGGVANARRTDVARRLRIDWLDCTQPPWAPKVHEWLSQKSSDARRTL
ncbi:MAG TPA: hypothetical protein VMF52_17560 [Steroidobacteraceae bacterium]|nr:hypothetical protein [Steroidobacteraceae bacterium]